MGVSEYFNLVRENLGFLAIFAFIMPCTVRFTTLVGGESALVFTSIAGVAGAYIIFEGITFDFDFFRFVPEQALLFWAVGLIFVIVNVIILAHIWLHSQGKKTRTELLTSAGFMTAAAFFFSGFNLIPLPWVAGAAIVRAVTVKPKKTIPVPSKAPEEGEETLVVSESQIESEIFEDTNISSPMRRRIPRFFIHGIAFSLLDLIFGLMSPILIGVVYITGTYFGSTGLLVSVTLSFGSLFIGGGLINAWVSERVWKIKWDYGIGVIFLSGIILFVITQVLVSPLSFIVNTFLLDSILGIAIVVVFRYTIVAFFIGIVGLLISLQFKPEEKPDELLDQIEQVVKQPADEEFVPDYAKNEQDDDGFVPDEAKN